MDMVPVYVGLDYATSCVQVCVLDDEGKQLGNRRCANDVKEIVQYAEGFGHPVRAAIEAGTGSADLADGLVQRAGWSVSMAHPGYVHRMKQNPDKTDYSDARMLADLERVGYLPKVWLAPQSVRELRRLVRYRQQLVDWRRSIKLRVSALLREHRLKGPATPWTVKWRAWLKTAALPEQSRWVVERQTGLLGHAEEEIGEVERHLEAVTGQDAIVQALCQYKGIGLVTACVLRAEIGDFGRFRSGKQLSRFCGLTPQNASSGARQADAGLIRAGNPYLRATLIEAAHRLSRCEARWAALKDRLRAAGKPGSVASAAVANRWVRWLFHQVRSLAYAA